MFVMRVGYRMIEPGAEAARLAMSPISAQTGPRIG
jgi:hypothetical protein